MNLVRFRRDTAPAAAPASAPTTTSTARTPTTWSTSTPPHANDRQRAATVTLARSLDALGLGELLADTRTALDRARAVRDELDQARLAGRERYEQLREQLAAGTVTAAAAYAELPALLPDAALVDRLTAEVVQRVESEAFRAARRAAPGVLEVLSARAGELVAESSTAAARVVDLAGYVAAAQRAMQRPEWDGAAGRLRGWPAVEVDRLPDERLGEVGRLRALNRELVELRDAARILAEVEPACATTGLRKPPARTTESYLERWCPLELRVAAAAAWGWEPGVWPVAAAALRPGEQHRPTRHGRRPGDPAGQLVADVTRSAVADVERQQRETAILRAAGGA